MSTSALAKARLELAQRLRGRLREIEPETMTRVRAIDSSQTGSPEYATGLRTAIHAALDYGLAAIETGEEQAPPIPTVLYAQARLAARNGIGLDTVLRRYFAGYTLLGDFLIEEAQAGGFLHGEELKRLLRTQAALFDRLLAAISEEYANEAERDPERAEERATLRIEGLLGGELLDTSEIAYDFDATHLGLVARGRHATKAIQELSSRLDCRLLIVARPEECAWAWLGARADLDAGELKASLTGTWPAELSLAIGESARGLSGWRLTHEQAKAAFPFTQRGPRKQVRYVEVALVASVLQDDLLAASLRRLYLDRLGDDHDDGEVARQTLRAYFAAGSNLSSAAAALGVHRRTVSNRLRTIEEKIGRPLSAAAVELEVALRLEEEN